MPKRNVPAPEAGQAVETKINLSAFQAGEQIVYYDAGRHAWKKGVLDEAPAQAGKQIKIKVGGAEIKAGPVLKKLEMPAGEVTINGIKYKAEGTVADLRVGPEGEILCNLVSDDGKEKLEHVDVEMIKNVQQVETIEAEVDKKFEDIKKEIAKVSTIKKKELTSKFNGLQKKLDQLVSLLGTKEGMEEVEEEQIKNISQEIGKMQKELSDGVEELSKEVERITGTVIGKEGSLPEISDALLERRDREMKNSPLTRDWETKHQEWAGKKDAKEKWEKSKKNWDEWRLYLAGNPDQDDKDKWKKKRKIKDDPEDPGAAPAEAGNEPKKPEGEEMLFHIYEDLKAQLGANLLAPGFQEILKEVKERSDRKIRSSGLGTDMEHIAPGKEDQLKEIIGKAMAEILEKHKKEKGEAKKEDVFDFKKDKVELDTKIGALTAEAQGINIEALVKKCKELKEKIGKLKEGAEAEKDMVQIWEEIGELEMEIFKEKRKAVVEKKPEKEIDIPDHVLAEIFKGHPKEVAAAMRAIYEDELGAAEGGGKKTTDRVLEKMKNLFGAKPDPAVLEKLRQCGIRSWDQFKKLWDKKYAQDSARILHAWAQDDLRGDVARRTTSWDRIKAIKWQLAGRIATNIALVGGGAIAATALFASGGLAGVGLAAAGGAAGGGVRAALQKFLFGRRGFEDRKQKKLLELANRKKQEAIAELMQKRFGANEDKFEAGTENMFATLVAEAIREVNAEIGKKETVTGGPELAGKAKAIYIQHLKEFKWEGEEPTDEQKRQFAIAINILMEKGQAATQEAVRNADPLVVRMLDGIMAGYSGSAASKEKYGLKGAVTTTALGAAAGVAFFSSQWYARGAMGALGGAAAGYHYGEGKRLGRLEKAAESQVTDRLIKADRWRKDFEKGMITPEDTAALCDEISKFNRYLKGIADSEAEENIVALLQSPERAVLRKQMENLVYESYRRGLFAHLAILEMQKRSVEAAAEGKMTGGDRFKKWIKKNGERTIWAFGGAVAGAALAIAAGEGIKEVREHFGIGPGSLGRKLGIEQAPTDKAAFGGKAAAGAAEVTAASAARGAAGTETAQMAETIQGTATISKGQGILHATDKLMHDQPDYFKGWSKQQVHDWKVQELRDMGFKFRGGKWGYPVTVHEGAKVNLMVDAQGKPHLELGTEHITEHKYVQWKEAAPAEKVPGEDVYHKMPRYTNVQEETAAELRGEEFDTGKGYGPQPTAEEIKAAGQIYTRVEELPKAGAAGVAGEEIIRHEKAHAALDKELAGAKAKPSAADEVVRKPRGARAKVEIVEPGKAKAAALNIDRVQKNLNILHTDWNDWFGGNLAEDHGGVIEGLRQKVDLAISDRPDLQARFDQIVNNDNLTQQQKMDQLIGLLPPGALGTEERIFLGADYVRNDKLFTEVIQEGFRYTIAKNGSHAMKVEDLESGNFTFLSTGRNGYLYGVMPDGRVGRI